MVVRPHKTKQAAAEVAETAGHFLFVWRSKHRAIREWSTIRQPNSDRISQTLARVQDRAWQASTFPITGNSSITKILSEQLNSVQGWLSKLMIFSNSNADR